MSTLRLRTQQVNLVDPSLLRVPERLGRNTLLTVLALGVVAVSVHWSVERYEFGRQLSRLTPSTPPVVAAETTGVEVMPAHLLSMQERIIRGETLRSALAQGGDLPDNAGAILNAVILALPDTMWLTELQVLGDKSVVISGGTLERPALATFSQQLEANPTLTGTPITIVQLEPRSRQQVAPPSAGDALSYGGEPQSDTTADAAKAPAYFAFTLATRTQSTNPGGQP